VAASGKPAVPAGQAAAAPFTRKQRRAARSARDQSASRRTWRGGHNAVRADAARRARIWANPQARCGARTARSGRLQSRRCARRPSPSLDSNAIVGVAPVNQLALVVNREVVDDPNL
jgi:hypothetical protein